MSREIEVKLPPVILYDERRPVASAYEAGYRDGYKSALEAEASATPEDVPDPDPNQTDLFEEDAK